MRFRNSNRDMNDLEDTKCEIRATTDLGFFNRDRPNVSSEEDDEAHSGPARCSADDPSGGFFEDTTHAWLARGARLAVLDVKSGVCVGSWTFVEAVTCVSEFPSRPGQVPLLLVGLDNGASRARDSRGMVCVLDCASSRVLRAIRMPAGVEQTCVISGGAEWEDRDDERIDNVLGERSGVACVALRNLDHLLIDLRRDSWGGAEAKLVMDEANPAELKFAASDETTSSRQQKSAREKHAAFNLMNKRLERYMGFDRGAFESSTIGAESASTTSLICWRRIGCLVAGCLGRIIIWETGGDVKWISEASDDEGMEITHLALVEPSDDPKPFCYLWSAHQDAQRRAGPMLQMHAMLFERKYTDSRGVNSYYNLESNPSVKFELELDELDERISSLRAVARDNNSEQTDSPGKRGEDSVLLIRTDKRAIVFDLNQWYKEQMPRTIGDCVNPNAILARYRTRPATGQSPAEDGRALNCAYVPNTLKEFPRNSPAPPPEEVFYPNSLSLEWIDLSASRLTFWSTRGRQSELLREILQSGPVTMIDPTETYERCVAAGLVSTSGDSPTRNDKDRQREALLSLILEQRCSRYLLKCAREWSDGSASCLFHSFLRWGMQRASSIKLTVDRLSVPLYDQSGTGIGEIEIKQLRFYCQQLECITNVVENLDIESVDLTRERRALGRVTTYLRVLLWFYDVGLLPEAQETNEDTAVPMSLQRGIPYPYERLASVYREKRREFGGKLKNQRNEEEDDDDDDDDDENLFIDELVNHRCNSLRSQWEKEGLGGESSDAGCYPPSSLQSLLRSFLTDCSGDSDSDETDNKHQITIYLLMDLAMLLQDSCPSVDQLIKYPSAFKLSPSLIKLTQAFWLLHHEDYHGFLDMMTGQLVSDSDVKDWHHRLVMRTLIRNNRNKLALIYLRVRKPPLSSIDQQSIVIDLSVEHGLVQSAFHCRPARHYAQLLTGFYRACRNHGRLNDVLHLALDHEEEMAFVKFLQTEGTEETRLLYYLQRCRYAEANNASSLGSSGKTIGRHRSNEKSASSTIFNAYRATLPEITRKFSANLVGGASTTTTTTTTTTATTATPTTARYPRPMSHRESRARARDIHEMVVRKTRETYQRDDRSLLPFVSAPCRLSTLESRSTDERDANDVLFVERIRKSGGKRSLDEMRADDLDKTDNEEDRKRRRIGGDRGTSPSTVIFDTPLVKRKKQISSVKSVPIETPHSILKIRQMALRDSMSPCNIERASGETTNEQKTRETEGKRRQIRFSLGQRGINRDETTIADASLTNDIEETTINHADGDTDEEEKAKAELNLGEDRVSEEDVDDEEEEEETYYSPNVSGKSCHESTLLSEGSCAAINISGPRPRPSLRRRSNETTFGDLTKARERVSSGECARIAGEISIARFSRSVRESALSYCEQPVEKCRDTSTLLPLCANEPSEHLRKYIRTETGTNWTRERSSSSDEFTDDHVDDKNSDVLMEVDGFGLDRESIDRSSVKNNWCNTDGMENVEPPSIHDVTEFTATITEEDHRPTGRPADDNRLEAEMNVHAGSSYKVSPSLRVSDDKDRESEENANNERTVDESRETAEDDGPSAPRFEEEHGDEIEDDEVFRSLTNSMEVEGRSGSRASLGAGRRSVPSSHRDDEGAKESPGRPIDDRDSYDSAKLSRNAAHITDDESSRSVDGSEEPTVDSTSARYDLDKTVSVERSQQPDTIDQASNITNDDSSSSFDSSLFTPRKAEIRDSARATPRSFAEEAKVATNNDDSSSRDSSIFSTIRAKKVATTNVVNDDEDKETNENSSDIGDNASSDATNASEITNASREERYDAREKKQTSEKTRDTENAVTETSRRETRSRRASSVIQEAAPMMRDSAVTKRSGAIAAKSRRAASLAKDLVASTNDDNDDDDDSILETPTESQLKSSRLRRSISRANDPTPVKAASSIADGLANEGGTAEEGPIGRRTRRATSMQKETSLSASSSVGGAARSPSKISPSEDSIEEAPTARKTTRAKRGSSAVKDVEPKRTTTRASASTKNQEEEEEEEVVEEEKEEKGKTTSTRRNSRKRGSSVPKETSLEASARSFLRRSRRGGSVIDDVIPEEPGESVDRPKRGGRPRVASSKENLSLGEMKTASLTMSTRGRFFTIASMPEERAEGAAEEPDEASDGDIFTRRGESTTAERGGNTRARRAASVDSPLASVVKRRTRTASTRSQIVDEEMEEETLNARASVERRVKLAKRAPTRKGRIASASAPRRELEEIVSERLPPGRTRKLSERSNDVETFSFSPPGKARDGLDKPRPTTNDDAADSEQEAEYVFSPPHTRSRHVASQPRRKINRDFIPITEAEREAGKRAMEGFASRPRVKLGGQSSDPFLYRPRKVFSFPKRSKNLTEESRGSSLPGDGEGRP